MQTDKRRKDYLICVDSDGCAMDTMDIKHIRCFGPCMVKEWGLEQWESQILHRWNEINLYTLTRGINRFKGLSLALREINDTYMPIEDIDMLEAWVRETKELSNAALTRAIQSSDSIVLRKALSWSQSVNQAIDRLPFELKKPFDGVREGLKAAHEYADVVIVSSANRQAVVEEWQEYGLLDYVDEIMAQDVGSKAFCIREMLKKGYSTDKVMMVGDALGDYEAACKNGVFYYPILVRNEKKSWVELKSVAVEKLTNGQFAGEYQQQKIDQFMQNLGSTTRQEMRN